MVKIPYVLVVNSYEQFAETKMISEVSFKIRLVFALIEIFKSEFYNFRFVINTI